MTINLLNQILAQIKTLEKNQGLKNEETRRKVDNMALTVEEVRNH